MYEFIPGRLFYTSLSSKPPKSNTIHYFSTDTELVYWNFFLDFGPLNLGHLLRFCLSLNAKLEDIKLKDKTIVYYSGTHGNKRANSAFLICGWCVLYQHKLPDEAYAPFRNIYPPFPLWHDATPSVCHFTLSVLDTLKGLYKAYKLKYFDLEHFDLAEYEHYEQVENGDLNWCMAGKFVAFAGPHASKEAMEGYFALSPDDYVPYFKKKNVTLVVRFNKKYYDARRFTSQGIDHSELYFLDGTNPPEHILFRFLQLCEETPGAVAVHCKAGLGRTGTCIGSYMMKHHRLTAEETIGWLRIVRPGSVIGPQQQFLKDIQARMWREGDIMRQRMGITLDSDLDDGRLSPSLTLSPSPSPIVAERKISRESDYNIDSTTNRFMSSLNISEKKSTSSSTPTAASSRLSSSGKFSFSNTVPAPSLSTSSPEDNGEVTQGDVLRQRRTHGHHLTPSEAKLSSSHNKVVSPTNSASASKPSSSQTRPTTRSQIGRLLGK